MSLTGAGVTNEIAVMGGITHTRQLWGALATHVICEGYYPHTSAVRVLPTNVSFLGITQTCQLWGVLATHVSCWRYYPHMSAVAHTRQLWGGITHTRQLWGVLPTHASCGGIAHTLQVWGVLPTHVSCGGFYLHTSAVGVLPTHVSSEGYGPYTSAVWILPTHASCWGYYPHASNCGGYYPHPSAVGGIIHTRQLGGRHYQQPSAVWGGGSLSTAVSYVARRVEIFYQTKRQKLHSIFDNRSGLHRASFFKIITNSFQITSPLLLLIIVILTLCWISSWGESPEFTLLGELQIT